MSHFRINLGLAYQLHGSHNDARRYVHPTATVLIKALELDKDSIEAMNNLANLHKAKGEVRPSQVNIGTNGELDLLCVTAGRGEEDICEVYQHPQCKRPQNQP
eukprot:425229-Amorphochlora_amoeboformis.AAC.1